MNTATTVSRNLAAVVADALKAAGTSQRQAAEKTGIPLVTLNRRLTGHSPFTVPEVAALADLLGVSVVELFLRADRATAAA